MSRHNRAPERDPDLAVDLGPWGMFTMHAQPDAGCVLVHVSVANSLARFQKTIQVAPETAEAFSDRLASAGALARQMAVDAT